MGRKLLPVSKC